MRRLACGLVLLLLACANGAPAPPERIVLILVDTLRRDYVGVYGAAQPTPNMDRIASGGTVFRNAVSSFHSTPTSMGALFTGRTPSLEARGGARTLPFNQHTWCGLARFAASRDSPCVPRSVPTLAEKLSEQGYWTIGVHAHPLLARPAGFDRGFRDWREGAGARPEAAARPDYLASRGGQVVNALAFAALDARPSDHFFLYVHYLDVHDWHLTTGSYAKAVAIEDAHIGALLDGLEQRGLLEGAAVILTADHGESLGDEHFQAPRPRHAGNPSFQPVLRVPLIVGGVSLDGADDFIRGEDVYRLIVELAGGEVLPSALEPDELLLTERRFRTYRKGRWKSYWRRGSDEVHLVDLEADPRELRDVAAQQPQVLALHRQSIATLVDELSSARPVEGDLEPEARERLRALGYLEPAYDLGPAPTAP